MDEFAPKLITMAEDKVTMAISEKFMEIQQRVDNHANQL